MSDERTDQDAGAELAQRLLALIAGGWTTQAVYVAAELGLADALAAGPRTSADLAAATGAHPGALHRLLRALATIDVCRERADGAFELTPMGALLRAGAPASLGAWARWWGGHLWPVWGRLLPSVRTGESARSALLGTEGFDHLDRDPGAAAVFNAALVELSRLTCASVVRAYDFSALGRIVDVGGGYGELLVTILRACPDAAGVVFDRPHAIEGARRYVAEAGLAARCECVAGDFFQAVPAGGDGYILQSVLHDWDDERGRRILDNCRRAMGADGRLLLVEHVVPERLEVTAAHQAVARSDLHMLVALGAKERTAAEFRDLLDSAGFRMTRVVPAAGFFSVIEARPRS